VDVTLRTLRGEVGRLTLVGESVVADSDVARHVLEHNKIVEPATVIMLTPNNGARYLRAVPANLNGTYFWATLEE
jgi:hypothetical protein